MSNHPNRRNNNNDDRTEDSRKLWPFFFIIPILGFSFLPITGTVTPPTPFTMNFAGKASGITLLNQQLTAGTVYCTGVTSQPLILTKSHNVTFSATYTIRSANVTGQVFFIIARFGNAVPSTTFAAGSCNGTTGTARVVALYCAITTQAFTISWDWSSVLTANTWYLSIDLQPLTTNVLAHSYGSVQNSNVQMLEIS
jgi:hypothetical protein